MPIVGPRLALLSAQMVGVAEMAELRGETTAAAWAITRHPDFPEPLTRLAMALVWLRYEVEAFNATERRPGPKPKAI